MDNLIMVLCVIGAAYILYTIWMLLIRVNDYYESNSNNGATDRILSLLFTALKCLMTFVCAITFIPLFIYGVNAYFEQRTIKFCQDEEAVKYQSVSKKYEEKISELDNKINSYKFALECKDEQIEKLKEEIASLEADIAALMYDKEQNW